MQLCEFCTQHDTCKLPKRGKRTLFASCDYFERVEGISQDRYEQVKALLLRMRSQAEEMARDDRLRYNIDVPMAFSPNDFLPLSLLSEDFYLDFYNCDLSDEQKKAEFVEKHKCAVEQYIGGIYAKQGDPAYEMLLAVQAELKTVIDAYLGDPQAFARPQQATDTDIPLRLLNKWLSRVDFQVRPCAIFPDKEEQENYNRPRFDDDKLLWWRTNQDFQDAEWGLIPIPVIRWDEPKHFHRNRYAVLFIQFLKYGVLEKQALSRCPVCKIIFRPPRTGPRGVTCGKLACKSAASRYPERYGIRTE